MNRELLNNIERQRGIIRANKTHTALDRLQLDLLKRAEWLFKNGEPKRAAKLCTAAATLTKETLTNREKLSEIRGQYAKNCGDDFLDELLKKYFGRYILSEPLNKLSLALTMLRATLLDGTEETRGTALRDVRTAIGELPGEYLELERLISAAVDRTKELLATDKIEHAYALIDAVHAFPEIAGAPKASLSGCQRCFVKPFAKRFNDAFFEEFDLSAIISSVNLSAK